MARLRLTFMGSADFSVPTLEALLDAGHDVAAVYSQPPRPAGRGHHMRLSAVHRVAESRGLPVRTPKTLRAPDVQDAFAELDLDAAVVAAYGLILPAPILAAPRLGCLNVHASLLPRWRGAAPIQRAILAGDSLTGVTIMQVDEGLDTGPMLVTATVPVNPDTTAETLHNALAALGARLIVPALAGVASGDLTPRPQPADGVTYAHKLGRDEGRLDWTLPASVLDRIVRALNPAPGVWFEHLGERIKVLAAEPTDATGTPGTVLDAAPTIACGTGALRPTRLQRPGRAPLNADAFFRGFPIAPSLRL